MDRKVVILVCLLVVIVQCTAGEDVKTEVVNITQGQIQGIHIRLPEHRGTVEAYLGIPFAKPPLADLRFLKPKPTEHWEGIYDASQLPNACPQTLDTFLGDFSGATQWNPNTPISEDCLYLNVWVPLPPDEPKAVIVFIHGGGFYSGSPSLDNYDPRYLVAMNDVIVVSISYRLGALGFLYLKDGDADANVGMYDQIMALQWVQDNIAYFGGDPDRVTLLGMSAGSASVSHHLMSPLSKTLFNQAIMESGTSNAAWTYLPGGEARDRSIKLTEEIGCDKHGTDNELLDCLRKTPMATILKHQHLPSGHGADIDMPFRPVIDGEFLPQVPSEILRTGTFNKYPILLGATSNEGSSFLPYSLPDYITDIELDRKTMNFEQFKKSIQLLTENYPIAPMKATSAVIDAIIFEYANWDAVNDTEANIAGLDGVLGDRQFTCPIDDLAFAYAKANQDVYLYLLSEYVADTWPEWTGVKHGDCIFFVMGAPFFPGRSARLYTHDHVYLAKLMMKYWTTFAKTG